MPNLKYINVKALGLNKNTNQLDVPPGSMSVASNVIIRRNGVVETRRGFKEYGTLLGSTLDRLKQLFIYKKRLFRHYNTSLEYDNGSGDFKTISGSFTETETGLRIKSLETNGNLYFTTNTGIQKLSVKDVDEARNTSVVKAGGIKAIDMNVRTDVTVGSGSGILPQDTTVAYRSLWGIKDINGNLIYGTPSPNTVVSAYMQDFLIKDLTRLFIELDTFSGSLVNDGTYSSNLGSQISSSTTGVDLKSIIGSGSINLCQKLDEDIKYTSASLVITSVSITNGVCTIAFSTGDPSVYLNAGDIVNLRDFKHSADLSGINGFQTLTEVTSTQIKFLTTETNTPITFSSAIIESGEFRNIYNNSVVNSGIDSLKNTVITEPTANSGLVVIQDTISRIITRLKSMDDQIISPTDKAKISSTLTTSANVFIDISIPDEVIDAYANNTYYFFQVYRTRLSVGQVTENIALEDYIAAGGAGDECYLVYEAYPTDTEIQNQIITIEDVTPDSLSTTPLYTNSQSGEGILQENSRPPFAKDIALFKNYTFYANTRTQQRLQLNLISVVGLNNDYNASRYPKLVISKEDNTHKEYSFTLGSAASRTIDFGAGASVNTLNTADPSSYFTIYPANSFNSGVPADDLQDSNTPIKFVVWFNVGTTEPTITPDYTGQTVKMIEIPISAETNLEVTQKVKDYLSIYFEHFSCSINGTGKITIDNINIGTAGATVVSGSGLTLDSSSNGGGERVSTKEILLYPNQINGVATSNALSIDQTARSIVRVLNSDLTSTISAYYLSNINSVPGTFLLENKDLNGSQFYVSINTNNPTNSSGANFSPDMTPELIINSMSVLNNLVNVTVVNGTGITSGDFSIGDQVVLFDCAQSSMNGLRTIREISGSGTTFNLKLDVTVTMNSTTGCIVRGSQVEASSNEEKSNRLYYSKNRQPEAVPVLNYLDVGLSDHAILRIVPLRDTLFIFKEDGLYRLSGQVAPFVVSIFDTNVVLIAPDSIGVTENSIFSWSQQGITMTSEAGSRVMSRPIDFDVLLLSSKQYTNFKTVTWGVGYPSDNSYLVFTNSTKNDTYATVCYRYCTLTQTWSTFDLSTTCGILGENDRLYAGYGDHNSIMEERKTLDRTDYADREYSLSINKYQFSGTNQLKQSDISNVSVGDVIIQNQTVTVNRFNSLLKKLDIDTGVPSTDYYSTLNIVPGGSVRDGLVALASKLDSDNLSYNNYSTLIQDINGSITAISQANPTILTSNSHGLKTGRVITITGANTNDSINGSHTITYVDANRFSIPVSVFDSGSGTANFTTDTVNFEDLMTCFNLIINHLNLDTVVALSNYQPINQVTMQETSVISIDKKNNILTLADALEYIEGEIILYKAIPAEIIFSPVTMGDPMSTKQFSEASVMFEDRAFYNCTLSFSTDLFPGYSSIVLPGDGNGIFGMGKFGLNFFGGARNSAPIRTYIPVEMQRCTYMNVKFNHTVAREKYSLYGVNLRVRPVSNRAYWS